MSNNDYILRSELIEHFQNYNPNWGVIDKDTVLDDIRDFPAANVEPVRHGRWIEQDVCGDTYYTCSVCGGDFVTLDGESPEENEIHFCPMCGAKMDAEPPKETDGDEQTAETV